MYPSSYNQVEQLCKPDELTQLALSVHRTEPHQQTLNLACLAFICRSCIRSKAHTLNLDPEPLIALGDEAMHLYATTHGLDVTRIEAAIRALERATSTYQYLDTLPA